MTIGDLRYKRAPIPIERRSDDGTGHEPLGDRGNGDDTRGDVGARVHRVGPTDLARVNQSLLRARTATMRNRL